MANIGFRKYRLPMGAPGYVYILTNSIDRQKSKVGRSSDPWRRLREHNAASNVVGRWTLDWFAEVDDAQAAERAALWALEGHRVRGKRELFDLSAARAVEVVWRAVAPWNEELGARLESKDLPRRRQEEDRRRGRDRAFQEIRPVYNFARGVAKGYRDAERRAEVEYLAAREATDKVHRRPYFWGWIILFPVGCVGLSSLFGYSTEVGGVMSYAFVGLITSPIGVRWVERRFDDRKSPESWLPKRENFVPKRFKELSHHEASHCEEAERTVALISREFQDFLQRGDDSEPEPMPFNRGMRSVADWRTLRDYLERNSHIVLDQTIMHPAPRRLSQGNRI